MKKIPKIKFESQQIDAASIEILSLELLDERLKQTPDHSPYQPHQLKFNMIILVTKGPSGIHHIDFEDHTYNQGSILLVAKEQIHAFSDLPHKNDGWSIIFTEEFFFEVCASYPFLSNHLYNSQLYAPLLQMEENKFKELCKLVEKINLEIVHENKSVRSEIAKTYFKVLLLELFSLREQDQSIVNQSPHLEEFIKFQKLLRSKVGKERKVKFYADQMNITSRQLNVITQSTINLSAKDFIISTLILEAKKFLKCSSLSSKEIAYQLGFDEPTNFTKFFKKHTQMLPSEFIQSV